MADALLVWTRQTRKTPLCSSSKVGTMGVGGRGGRERLNFPGSRHHRLRENSLSYKLPPTSRPVRKQSGGACLSPQKARENKRLPLVPGSSLSETALGFFISTPCENTGNPASPILKYLRQEGRHIVFPGPLFCLWTSSIVRFVNAWQKQTNSDLPWKWHVWKIMSKSMETMGEKLGHKTGYQLCTNWSNYSAGEVFCYCFISFGLLMVFFLFWLTKNCSREKSFILFFNILAILRVYLLIHLSSAPNEIYFLCFIENIQTFSWFNAILWATFVNK